MNSDHAIRLLDRIRTKQARVGVIGLGYVGLPLAVEFARAGLRTTGFDLDGGKVEAINAGTSYIAGVSSADVSQLRAIATLAATGDFAELAGLDAVTICVPTLCGKSQRPDATAVVAAAERVRDHLRAGMLVIVESTMAPGTTEEVVLPILQQRGLVVGRDFFLALSPERIDPGHPVFTTRNVPKVVGGVTIACRDVAVALYQAAVARTVPVSSPRAAEMVKLLENTFRTVNIAVANELAMTCARVGLDAWEVIDAAATKPFGFMPFYPGPGMGGECVPADPFSFASKPQHCGFDPRFIELAAHVNGAMPQQVADLVCRTLHRQQIAIRDARVLAVGVTYKKDVDDIRESPALDVMTLLTLRGATMSYTDPYVETLPPAAWGGERTLESVELSERTVADPDCVLILTDHSMFDYPLICRHAKAVVDARNATGGCLGAEFVVRLGAAAPTGEPIAIAV